MINNFILMNGYGLYVWLSFGITILACACIYYKTYKTLKKYEKDFAKELNLLSASEKKNSHGKIKNCRTDFGFA